MFTELQEVQGWTKHKKYDETIVHPDHKAEAKQHLDFMKEDYTLTELLPDAYVKEGIPFMNIEVLQNAKTQLGREKDFKDIELIKKYLAK